MFIRGIRENSRPSLETPRFGITADKALYGHDDEAIQHGEVVNTKQRLPIICAL
jgi:hypothetical protein